MEIFGELIFKNETKFISDSFQKREFVIKTNDQYSQEILLEVHNDKINFLIPLNPGDWIKCHINIRGKSYINAQGNKQWFNQIVVYKIEKI